MLVLRGRLLADSILVVAFIGLILFFLLELGYIKPDLDGVLGLLVSVFLLLSRVIAVLF